MCSEKSCFDSGGNEKADGKKAGGKKGAGDSVNDGALRAVLIMGALCAIGLEEVNEASELLFRMRTPVGAKSKAAATRAKKGEANLGDDKWCHGVYIVGLFLIGSLMMEVGLVVSCVFSCLSLSGDGTFRLSLLCLFR